MSLLLFFNNLPQLYMLSLIIYPIDFVIIYVYIDEGTFRKDVEDDK